MHFLRPQFFDAIVPRWMPLSPRFWTNASGVAELAAAGAVVKDSRIGGWAALLVFIGVYPANLQDTVDHWPPNTARGIGSLVRLPVQFALFAWAWKVAHAEDGWNSLVSSGGRLSG